MDNEGDPCQRNSDCPSNVCKMIYRGGQPVGRRCLNGGGVRYTKDCRFPKDCQSGVCQSIYDDNKNIVARKCVKAKRLNRDNGFDQLMNKTSGYEQDGKYGVSSRHAVQSSLKEMGKEGPVTQTIVHVINIIFDVFSMIVYDFRVPAYDHGNQAIMYSIFANVALGTFHMIAQFIPGGGIIGGLSKVIHEEDTGKCNTDSSRPIDMWYIRTIITIIFPPLGVLMAKGFTGFTYILTSCLLTALFYFPGLIYSLSVINSSKYAQIESEQRNKGQQLKNNLKRNKTVKKHTSKK